MITRRIFLSVAATIALAASGSALAQGPVKVGMSMPQTGPLGAGGKSALVGLQMWVEDVNKKGGMLGRKVEFIVYDDQTNPALTPSIYTKLLDVDKVDLLIAPYGTVPTAPIMPMVKQRGLLLMGNFSFQVNAKVQHDMWFNNSPWNDASSWSDGFIRAGQKAGAKTVAILAADQEFAQNLANGARELAKKGNIKSVYDQNYPPATTDFSSLIRGIRAARPEMVFVMSYPNDSVAIIRAVNEIGVGPQVQVFGGGMRITPNADPSDGLFDVQIHMGSKLDFVRGIPKVYKGTHVPHPRVLEHLAAVVEVACDPPGLIEADGEVLGTTPATFRTLPAALRLKT